MCLSHHLTHLAQAVEFDAWWQMEQEVPVKHQTPLAPKTHYSLLQLDQRG